MNKPRFRAVLEYSEFDYRYGTPIITLRIQAYGAQFEGGAEEFNRDILIPPEYLLDQNMVGRMVDAAKDELIAFIRAERKARQGIEESMIEAYHKAKNNGYL